MERSHMPQVFDHCRPHNITFQRGIHIRLTPGEPGSELFTRVREDFVSRSSHAIWKEKGYEKVDCMGYESASHRLEIHDTSETNGRRCVFLGRDLEICLPEPECWAFHKIGDAVSS